MPAFRTLAEFGDLLPAEEMVLARMAEGGSVGLGEDVPAIGDASRKLRADFVAFLARGGETGAEPPPRGLHIRGAWIAGTLDLRGPAIDLDLGLYDCRFDAPPNLMSARLANLYLNGSHLPGIRADRLETRGGVFLCNAVVTGEARFLGARLGGNLECDGARFEHEGGDALSADGLETQGGVFLGNAMVKGAARFVGARLGNNLECDGARFENEGKRALNLAGARVEGVFLLRDGASVLGGLDMTAASFEHINDDRACWPAPSDLILDRCRYEAFIGGPVDARSRLDWLALQDESRWGQDFWPQPYEQLARVFRDMGHRGAARTVMVEKERRQRRAERDSLRATLSGATLRGRIERAAQAELPQLADDADALLAGLRGPDRDRANAQIARARSFRVHVRPAPDDETGEAFRDIAAARARLDAGGLDPALAARRAPADLRLSLILRTVWDHLLGVGVGYGHRTHLPVVWLCGFWLLGAVLFAAAEGRGAIKPNTGYTLRAEEWVACAAAEPGAKLTPALEKAAVTREAAGHPSQLACFLDQPEAAQYPRFNALVYSLDTLLPIVTLEMQAYWIPDETKARDLPALDRIGWWARIYLWLHIALGWGLSLLAVAGFSGLVKSD